MNKQKQERALRKAESISRKMEKYKPIYDAYMSGATLRKIGAEYGISYETVRQIVNAEKRRVKRDVNNVEYTSDRVNVVRCRDCKYGEPDDNGEGEDMVMCTNKHNPVGVDYWLMPPEWFCADGERRETNA